MAAMPWKYSTCAPPGRADLRLDPGHQSFPGAGHAEGRRDRPDVPGDRGEALLVVDQHHRDPGAA